MIHPAHREIGDSMPETLTASTLDRAGQATWPRNASLTSRAPEPNRQLTKRAALSESLRDARQMAPSRATGLIGKLSGQPPRGLVFAQYWPFPALSKMAGS